MIRIVAPFRPMPAEFHHHVELPTFDWMDAIRMLSASVQQSCGCAVQVLTDVDTDLPMPSLQYVTHHRRLMLWYLEICACYLESPDFDRDTIMLDSDQLVFADLRKWFVPYMDLGILVRPTPKNQPGFPILNGVQFWAKRSGDHLARFYREALAIAEALPEADKVWGADTVALERLLVPLDPGALATRSGVRVRFIPSIEILDALSEVQIRHLQKPGKLAMPFRPVLDFRGMRKPYMRPVFEATLGRAVPA